MTHIAGHWVEHFWKGLPMHQVERSTPCSYAIGVNIRTADIGCFGDRSFSVPLSLTFIDDGDGSNLTLASSSGCPSPAILRVPVASKTLVAGDLATELILVSQRVLPHSLGTERFRFEYPCLEATLRHEFGHTYGFPDADGTVYALSQTADAEAIA